MLVEQVVLLGAHEYIYSAVISPEKKKEFPFTRFTPFS